jgi:hypothetical protein
MAVSLDTEMHVEEVGVQVLWAGGVLLCRWPGNDMAGGAAQDHSQH